MHDYGRHLSLSCWITGNFLKDVSDNSLEFLFNYLFSKFVWGQVSKITKEKSNKLFLHVNNRPRLESSSWTLRVFSFYCHFSQFWFEIFREDFFKSMSQLSYLFNSYHSRSSEKFPTDVSSWFLSEIEQFFFLKKRLKSSHNESCCHFSRVRKTCHLSNLLFPFLYKLLHFPSNCLIEKRCTTASTLKMKTIEIPESAVWMKLPFQHEKVSKWIYTQIQL